MKLQFIEKVFEKSTPIFFSGILLLLLGAMGEVTIGKTSLQIDEYIWRIAISTVGITLIFMGTYFQILENRKLSPLNPKNPTDMADPKVSDNRDKDICSYSTVWPIDVNHEVDNAKVRWFYGINLYYTIDKFYMKIKEKAENGFEQRFIFADPNGNVGKMVEMRYGNKSSDMDMVTKAINRLKDIKTQNPDKYIPIEIRVLDYLFPRTVYILDPNENSGRCFTATHTFQLGGDKQHSFVRKGNDRYDCFSLIYREYEKFWLSAKRYEE